MLLSSQSFHRTRVGKIGIADVVAEVSTSEMSRTAAGTDPRVEKYSKGMEKRKTYHRGQAVALWPECIQNHIEEIPNHIQEIPNHTEVPSSDIVAPPASLAGLHNFSSSPID